MKTMFRRFPLKSTLACLMLPALLAGCTNPGSLAAGRLPYGSKSVAAQDPFANQPGLSPTELASAAGAQQPAAPGGAPFQTAWDDQAAPGISGLAGGGGGALAPAPSHTYRAAYQTSTPQSRPVAFRSDENPFAEPTPHTAPAIAGAVEQIRFEMPVETAPPNPFAEVEGQPANAGMPATGSPDSWQSGPAASSADEFLAPAY